jgi:hypothetical protein
MNRSRSLARSEKNVVEKIKTHFMLKKLFYHILCLLRKNVAKYCGAGQASDENMAQVHGMLDT